MKKPGKKTGTGSGKRSLIILAVLLIAAWVGGIVALRDRAPQLPTLDDPATEADTETETPEPEPEPEPEPVFGNLELNVTPTNALISVDGLARGSSPVMVEGLPVDRPIAVQIHAEGHQRYRRYLEFSEKHNQRLGIQLMPIPQGMGVTSWPLGARIYIDGKLSGHSPMRIPSITSGVHRVRAELDGYEPLERDVAMQPGVGVEEDFVFE